jgi:hypothetical protein
MEDNLKKMKKMEDDLKQIGRQPKIMGDDLTNLIFLNGR